MKSGFPNIVNGTAFAHSTVVSDEHDREIVIDYRSRRHQHIANHRLWLCSISFMAINGLIDY